MRIIDQVCSFDQAKKLKELGLNVKTPERWISIPIPHLLGDPNYESWADKNDCYSAPNVAELGVLLGKYRVINWLWGVEILDVCDRKFSHLLKVHTDLLEAEYRCEALIWLIENEYLKAEDLKL